jgi:hypothetical protein
MKYKVLTILLVLILFTSGLGLTYSFFRSGTNANANRNVAKFIFNTESLDEFQLSLIGLKPGDTQDYAFAVSNNNADGKSDVTLEYQMTVKTYHLIPLKIELYKVNGETEELILTCDETYNRNSKNELVCDAPLQVIAYSLEKLDNYKLRVEFPSEYNEIIYSNLVDYIDVEIKSWQKI